MLETAVDEVKHPGTLILLVGGGRSEWEMNWYKNGIYHFLNSRLLVIYIKKVGGGRSNA